VDAFAGSASEEWEKGLKTKLSREELESKLKETMSHTRLMWMSAKEKEGVDDLMTRMAGFVRKVKETE
jgi:agmatine/peptidylarginine deiminase